MPYKNIVFVKLEKRLLNDPRWFGISEKAQLLYVKLLLGCAETYNNLPTDLLLLRRLLRIEWRKSCFESALKEIEISFPKFKKDGNRYYFEEFETKTNYIREIPSVAQVLPKDGVDKDKDKDKEIEKMIRKYFGRNPTEGLVEELNKLIKKYNFDDVNRAMHEAMRQDKKSISYVEAILKNKGDKNKSFQSPIMKELYGL